MAEGGGTWRGASRGVISSRGKTATRGTASSRGRHGHFAVIHGNIDSDVGGDSGMEGDEEEVESDVASAPQGRVQLEVLGEDSDSRKKRFESSLSDNRFMELKPLREEQRRVAIQQGLLPDPLKPTRLDEATDFVGTCEEMCPEFEREEREYQNNVDQLERYPGSTRIDPAKAVKAFHRPAAGNDQPLPSDVRPPPILALTLDYLFHDLLPAHPLHLTHPFLRDRTRAVRQDFTMQNVRGTEAIECNERIARYHVLALGTLREQSGFSESQELEQLRKVLKSLNEFYDDARLASPPIPAPNEPEFRAYNILTHLRDPDIIWSTELLPPDVFNAPLFQTALSLHSLAQHSVLNRGERASLNAFSRFFKLLSKPEVPYLFGCILSTHFGEIRRNALDVLRKAYVNQHSLMPASWLAKVLGCDDEEEVRDLCETLGMNVTSASGEEGGLVVALHRGVVLKNSTIKPRVSQRIVEAKRGSTPYRQVIDGANYTTRAVVSLAPVPTSNPTSFAPRRSTTNHSTPASAPFSASSTQPATSAFGFTTSSRPSAFPSSSTSGTPFGSGTPIVTPEATPPPPSALFGTVQNGSKPLPISKLNPAAAAFSPSPFMFGAPPISTAPPPSSQPPASLYPSAPSFFPPPAVPISAAPAPLPSFSFDTKSAPIPPPPTRRPPPPDSMPRKVSLSKPHSPSPAYIPTTLSKPAPRKPSLSPPHRQAFIASLTLELLRHVIQIPTRRACELALRERWGAVLSQRKRVKGKFVDRMSMGIWEDLVSLRAREETLIAWREARVLEQVLGRWMERTEASVSRGIEIAEERRRFERVARRIGTGPVAEMEVSEDEEEVDENGNGGGLEVEVDLSGLSLSGFGGVKERDLATAERIRAAQESRQHFWAPSTFLKTISAAIDSALQRQGGARRARFDIALSLESEANPFSTWLSCKFGLQDGEAQQHLPFVDVVVRTADGLNNESYSSCGLIVFDSTSVLESLDPDDAWPVVRGRLHALLSNVLTTSTYVPSLLVIACPSQGLTGESESVLAAQISKELALASLKELGPWSILLARLESADAQVARLCQSLFANVGSRPGKQSVPLSLFAAHLLAVWDTCLRRSIVYHASRAVEVLPALITSLNIIIAEINTDVILSTAQHLRTFPKPQSTGPLVDTVRAYLRQVQSMDETTSFALVEEALASRPPVSDARLVRLVLEHLALQLKAALDPLTTRRELVDESAAPALGRVQSQLDATMRQLATAPATASPSTTPGRRKRKASISPAVTPNGLHKKERNDTRDPLSELSALIRDTRTLLAPGVTQC